MTEANGRESQPGNDVTPRAPLTVVPAQAGTQRLTWTITEQQTTRFQDNTPPHRPTPAPVPLAAMSGVEGVRADKARRGPAWTAGRLRRGMEAESKTPARTPGSAAAKP